MPLPLTRDLALFVFAVAWFVFGAGTFGAGLLVVLNRTLSREVRAVSVQTHRLMQKGLTDQMSGLIGNASMLIASLSDLVRTTTGTGIVVMVIGLGMMLLSLYLVMFQIRWPLP